MPIAIVISCIAVIIAIYALVSAREQFDGEAFTKDVNKQLEQVRIRMSDAFEQDVESVRLECREKLDALFKKQENLGNIVTEYLKRSSDSLHKCKLEIDAIWMKLEKLGVKKHSKRGRPRKNKGESNG